MIDLLKHEIYGKYEGVYPYIVQIGTGGTGGYIVQHLAQMLGTSGVPHTYILADFDHIEEKNLRNQLFLEEEVGLKKADVLAQRYSAAYNIDIAAFTQHYLESVENIAKLFRSEYIQSFGYNNKLNFLPILIGAVDNNYTRKIFHDFFNIMRKIVYIDSGNESTIVPKDWATRPIDQWTEEERKAYKESGWSGQVVCGVKINNYFQPPIANVYPDILQDEDSIKPSDLSCGELSASEPQRVIVNKFAALAVANYLYQIIEEYRISNHITHFHAQKGYMRTFSYEPEEYEQLSK